MEEKQNIMREIKIEKIVLSIGGIGDNLEKGFKLLKLLTNRKPAKMQSNKRIPSLNVRPGLEVGAMVTLRKDAEEMLKKLLLTNDNILKKKSISLNNFSFGIKEYIEIPGSKYDPEIGIIGLQVSVVLERPGFSIMRRSGSRVKVGKKNQITTEETINFIKEKFNIEVEE